MHLTPTARRLRVAVPILVVLLVGGILYYMWDNWWVNWDGGFYLYLARSLHEGGGYVFPNNSPATFRGPGYPALFAGGWLFLDISARTAIWMSRGVLLAGGAVVAWVTVRLRNSPAWAVMTGLSAVVPGLILESGGWRFVPDGMAAVLVGSALVAAVVDTPGPRLIRAVISGLLMAMAVMVKETAVLYAPIVLVAIWLHGGRSAGRQAIRAIGVFAIPVTAIVLLWIRWADAVSQDELRFLPISPWLAQMLLVVVLAISVAVVIRPPSVGEGCRAVKSRTIGLTGLPIVAVGSLGVLILAGEPVIAAPVQAASYAAGEVARTLGWAWVPAMLLIILIMTSFDGERTTPVFVGSLLMIGVGIGQGAYAGLAGLSIRNGVGAVFGFALLLGSIPSVRSNLPGGRIRGALLRLGLGLFMLASAVNSHAINEKEAPESWDNPAVHELHDWLTDVDLNEIVVTPHYATYLWFLGGDLPKPHLASWHIAPANQESYELDDFCRLLWWGGDLAQCPQSNRFRDARANDRSLQMFSAESFGSDTETLVLITKEPGLVYLIEKFDLGERVFATQQSYRPSWGVVYQIDRERWLSHLLPFVRQASVPKVDLPAPKSIPLNADEYSTILNDVLSP